MLKNPVCLFVPEKYCLFLHVLSHLNVELLAYSSVVETQVSVLQLKVPLCFFIITEISARENIIYTISYLLHCTN